MGFTRAELETFRGKEVDDLIGPNLKLLFVGINWIERIIVRPGAAWTHCPQLPSGSGSVMNHGSSHCAHVWAASS